MSHVILFHGGYAMRKLILFIVLLILAGLLLTAKVIPMPDLVKPFRIRVDTDKIYVGEGATIYIYSAKDFKLLTTFGRAGEGPREFKLYPEESAYFDVQSDKIAAASIGKLSFFTKEGKFIDEKKLVGGGPQQFYRIMGDKLVGEKLLQDKDMLYKSVSIYDWDLNKIREIFRFKYYIQRRRQYNPIGRGMYIHNFYVFHNKIFIGGEIDSGAIHVFDANGKRLYTVKPELDKVKFTQADKKGYIESFTSNAEYIRIYERIKHRFKYPQYFPLWENFVVADNKIYIQTYKRNDADTHNEFLILNIQGEPVKRVWLPMDEYFDFNPCPYTIANNNLYQFVENEDTEMWELHIIEIL